MINTYGYMVVRNVNGIPLHIVEIKHCMYHGVSVFSNAKDAKNYIESEKKSLEKYGVLSYDCNFEFCGNIVKQYMDAKSYLFSKLENKQVYIAE